MGPQRVGQDWVNELNRLTALELRVRNLPVDSHSLNSSAYSTVRQAASYCLFSDASFSSVHKYASIPILKTKPLIKRKNPPLWPWISFYPIYSLPQSSAVESKVTSTTSQPRWIGICPLSWSGLTKGTLYLIAEGPPHPGVLQALTAGQSEHVDILTIPLGYTPPSMDPCL